MHSLHAKMLAPCASCIFKRSTSSLPGLMSEKQYSETPSGPSTLASTLSGFRGGGNPEMTPFVCRLPVGVLPFRKQRYQFLNGPAFFTQLHDLHCFIPWHIAQHFSGPFICLRLSLHIPFTPSKVYSTLASMAGHRAWDEGKEHFFGTHGDVRVRKPGGPGSFRNEATCPEFRNAEPTGTAVLPRAAWRPSSAMAPALLAWGPALLLTSSFTTGDVGSSGLFFGWNHCHLPPPLSQATTPATGSAAQRALAPHRRPWRRAAQVRAKTCAPAAAASSSWIKKGLMSTSAGLASVDVFPGISAALAQERG
mmetsp:Transcript_3603/g.9822  ORF Transcript_3603/g.9822 Transcript_3603/m.9822 type:complete len:308 (+) Transcript_3603:1338-2261(+)